MFTSRKVSTRTDGTKRAVRYMSQTQASFSVTSSSVGVERTFPVHAPTIAKIEVDSYGDVRRAKLYYLRDLRGKAAKIKELRVTERAQ